jgi:transcriptional regulator with XRE-family HTH domain
MPNNPSTNSLGDFVRRIRNEKCLTLAAVSNRSARFGQRITASYINRIENDPQRKVTADRLVALANGLGVPAWDLFACVAGVLKERADSRYTREPALTQPTPNPVTREESTMQTNGSKDYEGAAKATIDLVDHLQTPNELSDAVLETLIIMAYDTEMAKQTRINIWHRETGLSVESLAALYRLYETGSGYRRSRLYADYEIGRMERDHES